MTKLKIGVLGSTRGTVFQHLVDKINSNEINAEIKVLISNNADSYILKRGEKNNIKSIFLDPKQFSKKDYDNKISEILTHEGVEIVALLGYMKLLTEDFVSEWSGKAVNIHPSLLPDYAGKIGSYIYKDIIQNKKDKAGCTLHYINEELDMGPIILQKECLVDDNDTEETLKNKVQNLEKESIVEFIKNIANKGVK